MIAWLAQNNPGSISHARRTCEFQRREKIALRGTQVLEQRPSFSSRKRYERALTSTSVPEHSKNLLAIYRTTSLGRSGRRTGRSKMGILDASLLETFATLPRYSTGLCL